MSTPISITPVTSSMVTTHPIAQPHITTASAAVPTTSIQPLVPECDLRAVPWPTLIISLFGAVIIIYTAAAPDIDQSRRIFGAVFILLWTLLWAFLLWTLWRECHHEATWWLLLIPSIAMFLFFVLIIILNMGASI